MAVYKVLQDIEAEDKLLGPLTLKGFIYAAIAALLGFINFRLLFASSIGAMRWPFVLLFSLPMILFGILAAPLGREQPTEVWLLSRVRFFLKNRRRTWDQSGMNHLVTVTVPKKVERNLTKNLNQAEVKSRLQALASTLDSRGWAIKDVTIDSGDIPGYLQTDAGDSDRLIGASAIIAPAHVTDIKAADDILDEQNNVTAQHFDKLVQKADSKRKDDVANIIASARPGAKTSELTDKEQEFLRKKQLEEAKFHSAKLSVEHFDGSKANSSANQMNKTRQAAVTAARQAANMNLAQTANELSVASVAALANRSEVVINLH